MSLLLSCRREMVQLHVDSGQEQINYQLPLKQDENVILI